MIKEYFSLTSSERNGLFALFILVLALLVFIKVRQLTYVPETIDLSALEDSVNRFYASPLIEETQEKSTYTQDKTEKTNPNSWKTSANNKPKPLVVVELNAATAKQLTQIKGVGEFYAKNIVEERERLGGFSNINQLLAVYGMTAEKLNGMKKQITIDTALLKPKIGLNTADSFQLAEIYAIDAYCASRIVRYRERLGGYYDTRQLLDIFAIDEDRYQSMMCRLVLDTIPLRLLDINNADFKTVMKHPYINGYKNTKAIFRYLDYGGIKTWEEFCKIPYLHLENSERLRHYVKFDPVQAKAEVIDSTKHQE